MVVKTGSWLVSSQTCANMVSSRLAWRISRLLQLKDSRMCEDDLLGLFKILYTSHIHIHSWDWQSFIMWFYLIFFFYLVLYSFTPGQKRKLCLVFFSIFTVVVWQQNVGKFAFIGGRRSGSHEKKVWILLISPVLLDWIGADYWVHWQANELRQNNQLERLC